MVRKYARKTNRQEWSMENMQQAVAAVSRKEMGLRKASVQFHVPKTTLQRAVQKKLKDDSFNIDKTEGKFKCVFTTEHELELVQYLKEMEGRLFGLTMKDFRVLAFQLAERNKLPHPFNKEKKMAGEDWMCNFLTRHPELSARKPEATSGARAMGFNRPSVQKFFDLLIEIAEKHNLTADRIYNCDETGISVNPKGHTRIIAPKGKRQVGVLTSAERGETVTAELCISAAGAYMPPMLIFPRKRMQNEFELGLPPGGWAECHETGWITTEIFSRWFKKFVQFSRASKDNVVLLILDGHSTHTRNLEVIDFARENGVVMLCLPPHASHRLQPLDVTVMKPMSSYYEEETRRWLRSHPGKVITLWQVSSLFGSAFLSAAIMRTAMKGFEATGIWPINMDVFTDADFLPSEPTNIELINTSETGTSSSFVQAGTDSLPTPSTSSVNSPATTKALVSTSFVHASPQNIVAVPHVETKEKRKTNRKKGRAAILTSSPYKTELEIAIEISKKKSQEKEDRVKKNLKFAKMKKVEKNKKKSSEKKTQPPKKQEEAMDTSESSEDDDSDANCLYCNALYSKSTEGWIGCVSCHKWAHNSCADVDSDDDDTPHTCGYCAAGK